MDIPDIRRIPSAVIPIDTVRFWTRIVDDMLDGIRAFPQWTIIDVIRESDEILLVEVADPYAPTEAAGLICEPVFRTTRSLRPFWQGGDFTDVVDIADYGVPQATR